jgi:hypothetical protein
VSQPWHKASWAPSKPEPGDNSTAGWTDLTSESAKPANGDSPGNGPARGQAAASGRGPRLTGRGAITGMLLVFFLGVLAASWLHWGPLAGGSFLVGAVAAAWYTKQRDLLTVAVSPPLLFFIVVVCVKALTAAGNTVLSTVEGTALTLANVAPWLFAGVALSLLIAWFRGLPRCIAQLRRDLRPDLARPRPRDPAELSR